MVHLTTKALNHLSGMSNRRTLLFIAAVAKAAASIWTYGVLGHDSSMAVAAAALGRQPGNNTISPRIVIRGMVAAWCLGTWQ